MNEYGGSVPEFPSINIHSFVFTETKVKENMKSKRYRPHHSNRQANLKIQTETGERGTNERIWGFCS